MRVNNPRLPLIFPAYRLEKPLGNMSRGSLTLFIREHKKYSLKKLMEHPDLRLRS